MVSHSMDVMMRAQQASSAAAGKPAQVSANEVQQIKDFINLVPAGRKCDNGPEDLYGAVLVNGKFVAAVYNTGVAGMPDEYGEKLRHLMESNASNPGLAEKRLAIIAEALGGTVVKAPLPEDNEAASDPDLGFTVTFEADKNKTLASWSSSIFDAQFMGQDDKREDAS